MLVLKCKGKKIRGASKCNEGERTERDENAPGKSLREGDAHNGGSLEDRNGRRLAVCWSYILGGRRRRCVRLWSLLVGRQVVRALFMFDFYVYFLHHNYCFLSRYR